MDDGCMDVFMEGYRDGCMDRLKDVTGYGWMWMVVDECGWMDVDG